MEVSREELEKEAEEYTKISVNEYKECLVDIDDKDVLKEAIAEAYLACAEPREEQIAELEKEADEYAIKDCPDNFLCTRAIAKRGYLTAANLRKKQIVKLEIQVLKLTAQIEKMKCCENCKFRNKEYDDADFTKEKCIGCCPENDNWEFE